MLYNNVALAIAPKRSFYSFAAAYDSATQALITSALILHDSTGAILAHATKDTAAFACDGCARPSYRDGLDALYYVVTEVELPGFPYPVLLLDTSTVEGRALSLVTFTPLGAYSEYRVYEYVVNCILGDQP